MTFVLRFPLAAALLLVLFGCSSSKGPESPESHPLSMDDWKKMPPETKYKVETFERLKGGNPRLNDPEAWEMFVEQVIVPAKQQGR